MAVATPAHDLITADDDEEASDDDESSQDDKTTTTKTLKSTARVGAALAPPNAPRGSKTGRGALRSESAGLHPHRQGDRHRRCDARQRARRRRTADGVQPRARGRLQDQGGRSYASDGVARGPLGRDEESVRSTSAFAPSTTLSLKRRFPPTLHRRAEAADARRGAALRAADRLAA